MERIARSRTRTRRSRMASIPRGRSVGRDVPDGFDDDRREAALGGERQRRARPPGRTATGRPGPRRTGRTTSSMTSSNRPARSWRPLTSRGDPAQGIGPRGRDSRSDRSAGRGARTRRAGRGSFGARRRGPSGEAPPMDGAPRLGHPDTGAWRHRMGTVRSGAVAGDSPSVPRGPRRTLGGRARAVACVLRAPSAGPRPSRAMTVRRGQIRPRTDARPHADDEAGPGRAAHREIGRRIADTAVRAGSTPSGAQTCEHGVGRGLGRRSRRPRRPSPSIRSATPSAAQRPVRRCAIVARDDGRRAGRPHAIAVSRSTRSVSGWARLTGSGECQAASSAAVAPPRPIPSATQDGEGHVAQSRPSASR